MVTTPKRISYSKEFSMGSGQKNIVYTPIPQDFFEAKNKMTTRQKRHDHYQVQGKITTWYITGIKRLVSYSRCQSNTDRTLYYRTNVR